jgi:hypothetical protein
MSIQILDCTFLSDVSNQLIKGQRKVQLIGKKLHTSSIISNTSYCQVSNNSL